MIKGKYHDIFEQSQLQWPYEVNYGKENYYETDVLVLGGGVAGVNAAIAAKKEGVDVILVDKAPIERSGSGGVGHDHWLEATTNPASKITPEDFVDQGGTVLMGPMRYICAKTSWDNVAEVEKMGMELRDAYDQFDGAPFRDEKSKLLFAYDYVTRTSIRMFGGNYYKPTLAKEVDRLGIKRIERVMSTKLLYSDIDGKRRVTGAIGLHMQTGEMYIFKAKNVVVATGGVYGMWNYRNDVLGANCEFPDPNGAGDGHAMAWEVGAQFAMMERAGSKGSAGHVNGQPSYGGVSAYNTHYPCSIIDSDGKNIPWEDHEGNIIEDIEERTKPRGNAPFLTDFGNNPLTEQYTLVKDLPERIKSGEFKLPLYMDLPGMPEYERKAIWGLMVANEGKSLLPVYNKYGKAGFDPNKDLMQAAIMAPYKYSTGTEPWWTGEPGSSDRDSGMFGGAGGFLVDWNLKSTNIDGLYGAGYPIMAHGCSEASSSGRYAGRKAADEVKNFTESYELNKAQIEEEKERIYASLKRNDASIGWRELQAGLNKIMRDYLADYKSSQTMEIGLFWLKSLIESENQQVYVRNPHELARYMEVQSRFIVAEMYFEACLKRIKHHGEGYFDIPRSPWEPKDWESLQALSKVDGKITAEYLDPYYELKEPYAPTYRENFYNYNPDYDEKYKAKEDEKWTKLKQY
jgi:succinate dehydrogenase/fumarate reductase flavoprotein subunit